MASVSPLPADVATKSLRQISQRFAKHTLTELCTALGKDDSTVSRIRSGESKLTVEEFCRLLQFLGLKVVETQRVCVDRQTYESMAHMVAKAMRDEATARKLMWDDEGEPE